MLLTHLKDEQIPLSVGDANLDGFPDVLLVIGSKTDTKTSRALLMENVACSSEKTACEGRPAPNRRGLVAQTKGTEVLSQRKDIARAFFFDLDEKGTVDVVLVTRHHDVQFLFNNFYNDAFFLKMMGKLMVVLLDIDGYSALTIRYEYATSICFDCSDLTIIL
jgi:hypothetical protein